MKIKPSDIGYTKIENQVSVEQFVELTGGFHDTMIKEFKVNENAFVNKDNSMNMDFKLNGQLLIQSQWIDKDIEILFTGISKIQWETLHEVYSGNFIFNRTKIETISLHLDSEFEIEADQVYYRLIEKRINNPLFGGAVPDDEMTISDNLKDNWKQCQNCTESWISKHQIDKCPTCNLTTVLK